ncbi:MAG: EAL domain-containing protein [Betaproteobacteria bacterium]|nr:EAL domain-containing protein [Betaproteobacteria bacterium]
MSIASPHAQASAPPPDRPAAHWHEAERLSTLRSYDLVGSAPEPIYDEITKLATQICDVPFALIELIDDTGSWVKSVTGELPTAELARHNTFSRMVVDSAEPLEIADAPHDLRFHHDPLVTGGPRIRFYSGVPLLAPNGHVLGALSVVHTQPNVLSAAQRAGLHQLSDVVVRLFESRRHEETAAWLGDILDESLNEILVIDATSRHILYANEGARRNLGYTLAELTRLQSGDLVLDWSEERRSHLAGPLLDGSVRQVAMELDIRRKDGSVYTADTRAQRSRYRGSDVFVVIANDVTARKRAEEQLHREKEFAQITLASIGDALVTTDEHGRVTYLNPVAERLTGWSLAESTGRDVCEVFHIVSEVDRMRAECPVDRVLRTGEVTGLANNTLLLSRDGGEHAVEDSAAPIRDKQGRIAGVVLVFRDVSEAREMAHHLSWQASHDALTDLVNRREFERLAGELLQTARNGQQEHALLYLDLDQFKVVNDSCGHQAGDELLKQLSALLKAKMRRSDTLARLGGDEFGVLLAGCDAERARGIAQQLLETVQAFRFVWRDRLFAVSASIGVAGISAATESVEAVLAAADTACFLAKDKGRSQVQLFHMEDEEITSRRGEVGWASRLAKSIEENRFFLVFQHAHNIGALDDLDYVEVLLRLRDEQGRVVPPMAFIPAAERYQLMGNVDRWVVRRVLHCLAHHEVSDSAEGAFVRQARLAVNLSGVSLSDPAFLNFVLDEFDRTGANPARLAFEITETAAISNLRRVTRFMEQLKARGCRFALDDFGSGLSSFAYLKNMPVDYLKIDGMFVKGAAANSTDLSMVESINRIGHVMGMKTIAEFVENQTILDQMKLLGIDFVQGHHVHQPEPFATLVERGYVGPRGHTRGVAVAGGRLIH